MSVYRFKYEFSDTYLSKHEHKNKNNIYRFKYEFDNTWTNKQMTKPNRGAGHHISYGQINPFPFKFYRPPHALPQS
jgi:hypothetical protein